tara:strand:+ start:382 stop:729 length:348 start_codon:yes stop_codon:yes gene_type:complete
MSLIKDFLELVDEDSENITIDSLFESEVERSVYDKWIKIFTDLKPVAIVPMLAQITETYKMSKEEEIIVLAYVKYFEINIMKINKFMQDGLDGLEGVEGKGNENKKTEYSGSMFG